MLVLTRMERVTKTDFGCPDGDGDGYSNADENATAHPNGTADASPLIQLNGRILMRMDSGDRQDIWPNDNLRWYDTDSDGIDDNSDVCL